MADLEYWLWLTSRKGLGPVGALAVLDHFGSPERAYYGARADYEVLALPPFVQSSVLDKSMDEPNRILGDCDRLGLRIMTFQDADYPQRLRQIGDPPVVLYIKGKPSVLMKKPLLLWWECANVPPRAGLGRRDLEWSWPPEGRWWCLVLLKGSTPVR